MMKMVFFGSVLLFGHLAVASGLNVTRFGAVPNDGKDDTEAFLAAFRAVQTNRAKLIEIPKGRYQLRANGNPNHPGLLFPMSGVEGLTIRGRGAELIMTGDAGIFWFSNCRNITFEGFKVDWERPPFSQGTVIATASNYFDVEIENQFPVKGGEPVGAFMSYDPKTKLPTGRDLDVYGGVERTELLRPQVLRVHLSRNIPVPVGTLLVLRHQVYGPGVFRFQNCSDMRVKDVTVYMAIGMAVVGGNSTNITLKRFDVLIPPKSGRLMSVTADAAHFSGCKGTLTLEDCTFEGMGDDGLNVKSGAYLIVKERVDERTVLGQHNLKGADLPDPGDLIELSHPETLLPFATNRVRSASIDKGTENVHRIAFEDPLPAEFRLGDVLGNASRVAKLRMRRCTIAANRARGVLCQTRDAIIEDCTFRNCTGPGVLVLTEIVHFHESIGTRNVIVRNNLFENCNFGAARAEAALGAQAWFKNGAHPPQPGVHRDVTFEGNRIINTPNSAIFAVGVDGLKIRKNKIVRACLNPPDPKHRVAVRVSACSRIEITDNDINPKKQGAAMEQPIRIGEK